MNKILKIVFWIFFIVALIYFVYGITLNIISERQCTKKCYDENALGSYLIRSGNFKLDDTCVCFYEDGIKTFKLNEDEN